MTVNSNLALVSGPGAQDWQNVQDGQAIRNLKDADSSDKKRLSKSAQTFEAILITKWLDEAEKNMTTLPGTPEEEQQDNATKQFMGIAVQSLGENMSEKGGIGIAKLLMQGFERQISHSQSTDYK